MGGDTTTIFRRSNSVLALQGCIATLFWVGTGGEKKCKKVGMLVFRPKSFFFYQLAAGWLPVLRGAGLRLPASVQLLFFSNWQLTLVFFLFLPVGDSVAPRKRCPLSQKRPLFHFGTRQFAARVSQGRIRSFSRIFLSLRHTRPRIFLSGFCCFFEEDGRVGGGVCC